MKSIILALALSLCSLAASAADDYSATLTGQQEATPNSSPAVGAAIVTFDVTSHRLTVGVVFTDLLAGVTAAHIHCCTAAPGDGTAMVATMLPTFTDFPSGVTEGTYLHTFDTSLADTWNPAFISANGGSTAGAEAALLAGLNAARAYLNIHTTAYPGGEIRGFLQPVPEPAMVWLLAPGLLLMARRMRRHAAPTPL